MAIQINAAVVGDDLIQKKIKKLAQLNFGAVKSAILKSTITVEGKAKDTRAWSNVTGRLRSSITHVVSGGKEGVARFEGKI
jgi:hypothetical protein